MRSWKKHRRQCTLCERFIEIRQWFRPAVDGVWRYAEHLTPAGERCLNANQETSPPQQKNFEFA